MTKIEIRLNDEKKSRGLFDSVDRAARFLSTTMTNYPSIWKYERVKIIIGGVEFDPPALINKDYQYLGRNYQEVSIAECKEHLEHCMEIRQVFYEDSS